MNMKKKPLIKIKHLFHSYSTYEGDLFAVKDLNLEIEEGETIGLVGESGCGKSTVGKAVTRLLDPTKGEIFYRDTDLCLLDQKALKPFRRKIQIIFQDPYASLNPRMTIEEIVTEAYKIHGHIPPSEYRVRAGSLLSKVGLGAHHLSRYPHEFSGGQRQRVGIARALAMEPEFIVCDEPLSALDVSVQAQVVNLLQELQEEMNLTFLFIAHDLSMVEHLSHRVGVMYLGELVELASSHDLYKKPLHPYTQALLSAIPIPDPVLERKRSRIVLKGEIPSPLHPPSGCVFCTRCPKAIPICKEKKPKMKEVYPGHFVSCHLDPSLSS